MIIEKDSLSIPGRGMAQRLARLAHNQKDPGSNPGPASNIGEDSMSMGLKRYTLVVPKQKSDVMAYMGWTPKGAWVEYAEVEKIIRELEDQIPERRISRLEEEVVILRAAFETETTNLRNKMSNRAVPIEG